MPGGGGLERVRTGPVGRHVIRGTLLMCWAAVSGSGSYRGWSRAL